MADNYGPLISGYGGYTFQESNNAPLTAPSANRGQYGRMATTLLQGSQNAAGELVKGFEEQYRARAQGVASGYQEGASRMGGEVASMGTSPELVRRMLLGGQASSQAAIGSAYGDAQAALHQELAGLLKGTSVELTSLTKAQYDSILRAYLAKKARNGANRAGLTGLAGGALGAAATIATGGAAAPAMGYMSSANGELF